MTSSDGYANLKKYVKRLRSERRLLSCPRCRVSLSAREFEKHCLSAHGMNPKRCCVWCFGREEWALGEKHLRANHLTECFEKFVSSNGASVSAKPLCQTRDFSDIGDSPDAETLPSEVNNSSDWIRVAAKAVVFAGLAESVLSVFCFVASKLSLLFIELMMLVIVIAVYERPPWRTQTGVAVIPRKDKESFSRQKRTFLDDSGSDITR